MKHISRQQGFTIPEVLLTAVLFAIVVAGISAFSTYYFRNYSFSFEENQSIGIAQTGITTMVREMREARDGAQGAWPIIQTDDNAFSFYSDVTNDGLADQIRYFLDGTDLRKGVIEPSTNPIEYLPQNETFITVAQHVSTSSGPIFTYYNDAWPTDTINNPLQTGQRLAETRYMEVSLHIDIDPNLSAQPFTLRSGVQLRGLKDNL